MSAFETYPILLAQRTELLTVAVVLGLLFSPLAARGPFAKLVRAGRDAVHRLGQKLNRENRNVPTLVYRGIVAVVMLLLPAIAVGAGLHYTAPWATVLSTLSLVLWFGYCFASWSMVALWRQAKTNGLPLQLPDIPYLFADSHAVIRHLIATRLEAFAVGIVGGCFWYLLGGWVTMAIYLTLAAAAAAYSQSLAFGWAARSLFMVMDAIPRLISRMLLASAAIVTAHCKPIASILAPNWKVAVAKTLGVSLGGRGPNGVEPWVGSGKARLTPQHLERMLYLLGAMSMLLVATPTALKILTRFI